MRLSMTYNSATAPLVRNNSNCIRIYSKQLRLISFHKNNQGILEKKEELKRLTFGSNFRVCHKGQQSECLPEENTGVPVASLCQDQCFTYFFLIVPSRDVNKNVRSEHTAVLPQAAKREKS